MDALNDSYNSPIYDDQKEQLKEYTAEELFDDYACENEIPDVVMNYIWELEKTIKQLKTEPLKLLKDLTDDFTDEELNHCKASFKNKINKAKELIKKTI